MAYIDRYRLLRDNGTMKNVPFIKIPELGSDKYVEYNIGITRFDILANEYYKDPTLGWLIGLANPERRLEFDFEDGDIIRIPFPKETALDSYDNLMTKYYKF